MENTNEEIQQKIKRLELDLAAMRYRYKLAFEKIGGFDEAKKLHQEIKATETEIELLKKTDALKSD